MDQIGDRRMENFIKYRNSSNFERKNISKIYQFDEIETVRPCKEDLIEKNSKVYTP